MQTNSFFSNLLADSGARWFLGCLLALVILVPVLNGLVSQDSVLHIPTYAVGLIGKYLCFALLALSLDWSGDIVEFSALDTVPFLRWVVTHLECI